MFDPNFQRTIVNTEVASEDAISEVVLPGLRARQSQARIELIIDTACRLIDKHGYESVTTTYLPNNRIVRLADAAGHLTTLMYDVSGANLLRRDIGGMTPVTEHYTQSAKDFGGLLAQYSTANAAPRFYLSDLSQNIGVVANGPTISEPHGFQGFGIALPVGIGTIAQPFGFGGNAGYYTDPISCKRPIKKIPISAI